MVGVEQLCVLFYDDPAWIEEMMDGVADFIIAMMDKILAHTDIDVFGFWEDMAYKTGPLLGPDMLRKYALPRYRRVVDHLSKKGVKYFALDSDGDVNSLIPVWLDSGINTLYPFEAQCGIDVIKIRQQYGKDLRLWLGINKHALAVGPTAIDAELTRVKPLVDQGGYVAGLDHSVPPDVPFKNYCYYMDNLKLMIGA
jgi:uroporphyrinogen decarboxylase